jgi:hypothetical protein
MDDEISFLIDADIMYPGHVCFARHQCRSTIHICTLTKDMAS